MLSTVRAVHRVTAIAASLFAAACGGETSPAAATPAAAPAAPRPARLADGANVQVLLLGDDGHHQPFDRADQVRAPLRARGIDLHWTTSLDALSPTGLTGFHVVLVYANHPTIGRAQEQALLAFVRAGGGLCAVHSASACFANSPAWFDLIGARFQRHGTGTFGTELADPAHPLLRGFTGFTSWDETYVHDRHNPDRTVLEVRVDGEHREPWTWVRRAGEGRVFYTAWGHDQRTWGNPGFHDLLARGIRWAAGDPDPARPAPASPFTMVESDAPIPDYQPGRRWGESEEVRTMQAPLPPAASQARLVLPPGLQTVLFAAEPELRKPIAMTWDDRGRLFVAETIDYPNEAQPAGGGNDRIRICTDTDGDGRADHFTTFADGLSIPTGLCWCGDGVVVAQAPDLLLLRDTDGDDRADQRRVLLTGWGTGDTHAGPSNLRLHFDGRIWGTVGYAGFHGTVDGEERRFGSGIWAIAPDGSRFEHIASTSNNTWGLGFDEAGNTFASTANGNPSVHLAIPHRHYEQVAGMAPGALPTIATSLAIQPITAAVRQVDFHHQFTAGAGHAIYTARALPRSFWNRTAFVAEPTGHLVATFELEPDGSTFRARPAANLLASDDQWTAPIQAEVGPDGAIWVIDWYNYIVQHNPTPHGFRTGKGNAYETPLRDKLHGRILRLVAGATPAAPGGLTGADAATLLRRLDDDNLFWRLCAQRLLVASRDPAADRLLLARAQAVRLDALGLDPGALHALWALHGRLALADDDPAVPAALLAALRHPAAAVRRAAFLVLPRTEAMSDLVLDRGLHDDRDAGVRLQALLALADMPRSERAGRTVFGLATRPADLADPWLPDALTIAAAHHDVGFLQAALAASPRGAATPDGTAAPPPASLLRNGDAETGEDARPAHWRERTYSGRGAAHRWVEGGRNGGRCLQIGSERGTDTSWFQDVPVEPGRTYRLRGFIRTEGLQRRNGGMGALFNVHGRDRETHTSNPVHGDTDWTESTLTFESGKDSSVSINCLYGGWGQATGTAWFDDLELLPVDDGMPGSLGRIIARVTRSLAARAPDEAVVDLLLGLRGADHALAKGFLEALTEGWPAGRRIQAGAADGAALAALHRGFDAVTQTSLLLLCDRLGIDMAAATDPAAVLTDLEARVRDPAGPVAERLRAARQWLALADTKATVTTLCGLLDATAAPTFAEGLVQVLATSSEGETGAALLGRWTQLSPSVRRAVVTALCQRTAWTRPLLAAIQAGTLLPGDIEPQRWTLLEHHPDAEVVDLARRLNGRQREERAALVERLLPAAARTGDAALGAQAFATHCASCHRLGGEGGQLGPPLDGIGARPRRETLLAIVDPNQSVEANYVQWIVATHDGRVFTGRLDAETRTTIELLDLTGDRQVISRSDVKEMRSAMRSLMPETFHLLGEQGLADLLEFLARPR